MDLVQKLKYGGNEPFLGLVGIDKDVILESENRKSEMPKFTPPIVRNSYTVECTLNGCGSVIINGKEFSLKKGDCYILLPGDTIIYTSDPRNPRQEIWCMLGGERVGEALAEAGISSDSPFAPHEVFESVNSTIHKMLQIQRDNDISSEYMRTALVYELLGLLTRGKNGSGKEAWLKRAMRLMEVGFNCGITVSTVASEVGFERAYFSTLFKSRMGISPHEYINKLRIHRACELLERGMPICAVAESVGLDFRNFARLFKAQTGKTPTEFKKSLTQKS